jgi:hypothetical protein
MIFKILKIEKSQPKASYAAGSYYFDLSVEFEVNVGEEELHFGTLGKYYKALVMLDLEKYEEHYANVDVNDWVFEKIPGSEHLELKFKSKSPYELGYCKIMDISGNDCIVELEKGKYKYSVITNYNYITEAAVKQLEEMKSHIDSSYCRWGDFPEQVGAFRSGDPFSDFLGILETLDRFWD